MTQNSSDRPEKIFDWYLTMIEIGKFEVERTRTRFYETAKLHLATLAGVLAVASFGITKHESLVIILGMAVCTFGIVNAFFWVRQIKSSSIWEGRWYSTAAALEETEEFRALVGAKDIRAWSHKDVQPLLDPKERILGATSKWYRNFVYCLLCLYCALEIGLTVYLVNSSFLNLHTHFTPTLYIRIMLSISYVLVILGSTGMILFATSFPFSSRIRDLEHCEERLLLLNGYQVWKYSWSSIIIGTVGQLIVSWLT